VEKSPILTCVTQFLTVANDGGCQDGVDFLQRLDVQEK
jgi:hypothetical protein